MANDNLVKDINIKFPLFGKKIEIRIYDASPILIKDLISEIKEKALELEYIFNFFDSTSELSRLNAAREAKVSKHLLVVIKKALDFGKLTHGTYDVALGKMFLARKQKTILPKVNCSYRDVKIRGNKIILEHKDVILDLGSIAKGYITDQLVEYIKKKGISSALVNSRGDIRNFGEISEKIYIADPRNANKDVCSFILNNSAVATSGDYNQYDGDYDRSHIIGGKEIISLTVLAKNLMEADALATALFTCSKKDAKFIIKKYPYVRIFAVLKDKKVFSYRWFKKEKLQKQI